MQVESAPLDSLTFDPQNARTHDEKNIAAIKDSLARFGQRTPIVARPSDRRVMKGNGTLLAAQILGWKEIDVAWFEMTDEEAVAYGIADNRAGELAEWDWKTLSGLLADLKTKQYDISGLGFAAHELEPLLQANWSPTKPGEMPNDKGSAGGSAIHLTTEQKLVIERAVEKVRAIHKDENMSIGRALEIVCTGYLGGP
jgi:ParB-like chromosome segregation protein Spo0J